MTRNLKTTIAAIAITAFAATAVTASDDQWEAETLAYFQSLLMNKIWSVDNTATFDEIERAIDKLINPVPAYDLDDPFGEDDDSC